jgi:hypothetical protein
MHHPKRNTTGAESMNSRVQHTNAPTTWPGRWSYFPSHGSAVVTLSERP